MPSGPLSCRMTRPTSVSPIHECCDYSWNICDNTLIRVDIFHLYEVCLIKDNFGILSVGGEGGGARLQIR